MARRSQRWGKTQLAPFSYITHSVMRALQSYFANSLDGELKTGIALYMGISFLLSSEEQNHSGVGQWTRAEITAACGVSPASITRYAEHLEKAGVLQVVEDQKGGQGAHLWRLVEPAQDSTTPESGDAASTNGEQALTNDDEAIDGKKKTAKEDKQPPLGVPPEQIENAEKLCRWLSQQADEPSKDPYPPSQVEAALELIATKPKGELMAIVKWAHATNGYRAGQVRTAGRFRQHYDDIRVEWRTSIRKNGSTKDAEHRTLTERRLAGESL